MKSVRPTTLQNFHKKNGIDQDRIIIEPQSWNTYENAKYSARIIRKNDFDEVLLITSALHNKRAKACFHRQGIKPDIYPVDFGGDSEIEWQNFWKPAIKSLSTNHQVIRETVGIMAYMVMGYM
ncbi:MAG: hypothetical protein BRD49_02750 [Bacteroidetes bacterium SW_10_40_5]|nr:MAG: hypothetical protein BRD49_02750 [Bacteroidetes bacterium SW_10_40_5]